MCNTNFGWNAGDLMLIIWFTIVFGFIGFIALRMFYVRRSILANKRKNNK